MGGLGQSLVAHGPSFFDPARPIRSSVPLKCFVEGYPYPHYRYCLGNQEIQEILLNCQFLDRGYC
jgi:hypothetical protein